MRCVSKAEIAEVLAKTCKVDALAMKADEDNSQLETLAPRLLAKIYGQDEAIRQVVESVQMSKAGLLDDNKPLASLLFVGPTGVGKTEVARVLAQELGITLLRFDMSEYTEKHTVAKLIGSPAGYVGYEDGGLLTDAIRHPAAGDGLCPTHRQQGTQGRLPQCHPHHDLQCRRAVCRPGQHRLYG